MFISKVQTESIQKRSLILKGHFLNNQGSGYHIKDRFLFRFWWSKKNQKHKLKE